MSQTVEVRFKGTRKAYFLWAEAGAPLRVDEPVSSRPSGADFGRVTAVGDVAEKKCGRRLLRLRGRRRSGRRRAAPPKPVVRRATARRHPGRTTRTAARRRTSGGR